MPCIDYAYLYLNIVIITAMQLYSNISRYIPQPPKTGAKLLLIYGLIIVGASEFLMAALIFIPDEKSQLFRNFAIIVRALEGL